MDNRNHKNKNKFLGFLYLTLLLSIQVASIYAIIACEIYRNIAIFLLLGFIIAFLLPVLLAVAIFRIR